MFQVVYEYAETWPEQGGLHVAVPQLEAEIRVSPDAARRRAKGYLTREVGMAFRPGEPVLVWGERPLWRMHVYLHLRYYGQVANLGTIDVDATSQAVHPFSQPMIKTIQDRADEFASRLPSPPTAAS